MSKFNGTLMSLYLSDTAPANPSQLGEYTRVGNTKDLSLPRTRADIDLSDKDSGLDEDAVSGRRSKQITCTLNLNEGDPGQDMIESVYNSIRGEFWFLATQNLSGTRQYWGKGIVNDAGLNWPEEAPAQMNFAGKVVGVLDSGLVP